MGRDSIRQIQQLRKKGFFGLFYHLFILFLSLMSFFRCDCPDVGMIKLPNIFILWYTGDNGSFVLKRPDLPLQHAIMGENAALPNAISVSYYFYLIRGNRSDCSHSRPQKKRRQKSWHRRRNRGKSP